MLPVPMDQLPRRDPMDAVLEAISPRGRRILDVGCGDGSLMRVLSRHGASVSGLEVSEEAAARARRTAAGPVRVGRAEALPYADRSFDAVVFMKSLHHVPPENQETALGEAARVLVPGGLMLVLEPIAEGPFQEMVRDIDDETAVRAAVQAAIGAMCARGAAEQRQESWFAWARAIPSFEAMKAAWVAVDPARVGLIAGREAELHQRFHGLGREVAGGWEFDQAFRLNLLAPKPSPAPAP